MPQDWTDLMKNIAPKTLAMTTKDISLERVLQLKMSKQDNAFALPAKLIILYKQMQPASNLKVH